MRICLIYDCLYPHTVGGAERWYGNLAEQLVADGHDVTYVTLRQWARGDDPGLRGVRVVSVGPPMALYDGARRRIGPPLVFGAGVLGHLLRKGRRFDVIHLASFPYFSLLAAALVRPIHRYAIVVDWHEVWSRAYWAEYLGPVGGRIGWIVQRLCMRVPQRAFCFSRLHADRLRAEGVRGGVQILEGEYAGSLNSSPPLKARPVVVYAGRHIPEKRVPSLLPALVQLRKRIPELRLEIFGDGPDRSLVLRTIAELGLEDVVEAPGFVSASRVDQALRSALCMVLPSRREGYGLVVVEAAARGTPSVVVQGPDNAAVELIEEGQNGFVADSGDPTALAQSIVRVYEGGDDLRKTTTSWFERNAERLSLRSSLEAVTDAYRGFGKGPTTSG